MNLYPRIKLLDDRIIESLGLVKYFRRSSISAQSSVSWSRVPSQDGFWMPLQSPWTTCSCVQLPTQKKLFLSFKCSFLFFFQLGQLTSCPVTVHPWKELGSIFRPPPFPVRFLYTLVRSPELSCLSSFSLSSYDRCSHPLLTLVHHKYVWFDFYWSKVRPKLLPFKIQTCLPPSKQSAWPCTVTTHTTPGKNKLLLSECFTSQTSHILLLFIILFQIATWVVTRRKF